MMKYLYDPECEKLARHFLGASAPDEKIKELSQSFQDVAEFFTPETESPDGRRKSKSAAADRE